MMCSIVSPNCLQSLPLLYNNNNNNLLLLLLVVVVVVLVVLVQYRQKKPTHLCKISRYTNRVHLFISLVIASSL